MPEVVSFLLMSKKSLYFFTLFCKVCSVNLVCFMIYVGLKGYKCFLATNAFHLTSGTLTYSALLVNRPMQRETNEPLTHTVILLKTTENVNFVTQF